MSGAGATLFVVSALFATIGAIVTVAARRPLRAAMGLLVNIIALAGLFLTLNAHLLAALQLLVYAGAVVVLFVFVIMLIGPEAEVGSSDRGLTTRATAGALTFAVFMVIATSIGGFDVLAPAVGESFGTVEGLGMAVYSESLVPFEIISITLLVAIVGAIAIARTRAD